MVQLFNQTIVVGATPFVCPTKFVGDDGEAPLANASMREVAGVACVVTLYGPDGQTVLNVSANGQRFRRDKRISYFTVSGNGATLVIDVSAGEWEDPDYLTSTIAGVVATSTTNGALETGGNLAEIEANTAAALPLLSLFKFDGSGSLIVTTGP